jgi:GNAT superfamily N-acetyltransferase
MLARAAFRTNKDGALDYTPGFLESCYGYPGVDPELSPAFFEAGRMVAMISSFPRRVRLEGRELRLALLTLNSVDPEFRGYGLGIQTVEEAARAAKQRGYEGALFYCVDGSIANRTSVAGVKASGAACRQVFTLDFLMGMARPAGPLAGAAVADVKTFLELSHRLGSRLQFARVWTQDEAAWELSRYGAVVQALESGGARGLITGYVLNDTGGNPCAQIENVLWDDLDAGQKSALLKHFLTGVSEKAQIAVMPLWNYADAEVFRKHGFRRVARRLNVYLALWNGDAIPAPMDAMYIDVL